MLLAAFVAGSSSSRLKTSWSTKGSPTPSTLAPGAASSRELLGCSRLPDLGRPIDTASDNPPAVRRKGRPGNGRDNITAGFESEQFLTAVRSELAVTIRWPSGENATE